MGARHLHCGFMVVEIGEEEREGEKERGIEDGEGDKEGGGDFCLWLLASAVWLLKSYLCSGERHAIQWLEKKKKKKKEKRKGKGKGDEPPPKKLPWIYLN